MVGRASLPTMPSNHSSMKKLLACPFFLLPALLLLSQKNDHTWLFGYTSNEVDSNWGGTIIDFGVDPPQLSYQYMDMNFYGYNVIGNDNDGNLQFYTNGLYVANAEHDTIENGGHLNPGEYYDQMSENGYILFQGGVVVPPFDNEENYLLMHVDADYPNDFIGYRSSHLYCSKVDMSKNGGMGAVVEKNVAVLEDTLGLGKVTSVRHANGRDWWVIINKTGSSDYHRVLVSPGGIEHLGCVGTDWEGIPREGVGQAVFSPNGQFFARVNSISFEDGKFLDIYEFDRCAGLLSNHIQIHLGADYSAGLAFSPNSRFLYLSSFDSMYQYDMYAGDIAASQQLIAEYEHIQGGGPFYLAQLAPDGKIYLCTTNGVQYMHVVHQPNRPYPECDFEQHGLALPTHNSASMPNFPNYRLGPLDGSPCDTLGLDNVPVAKFRYGQDTADYLQVGFTDLSYYEPATWHWDFGHNNATSVEASPMHAFPSNGTYEVCLTVSNQYGEDTFCRTLELGTVSAAGETVPAAAVSVFPNPCRGAVNVTVGGYLPREAKVVLYDAVGQVRKTRAVRHGRNTLRLDGLRPGIYFYEVKEKGVLLGSGRLVKM